MDDLISRRDAVSRFSDLLMIELRGKRLPTWEEVYNAIKEVPSAQRNGKWIAERYMDEVDSCFYTRYKCSECGRIVYDSSLPYCHCGAEMERRGR